VTIVATAQRNHDELFPGHVAGNINVGNDRAVLLAVLTQLLAFIGYPRTLNGLAAINEVTPTKGIQQ
jgi:4-carboxymuconolactone decarboxylase